MGKKSELNKMIDEVREDTRDSVWFKPRFIALVLLYCVLLAIFIKLMGWI